MNFGNCASLAILASLTLIIPNARAQAEYFEIKPFQATLPPLKNSMDLKSTDPLMNNIQQICDENTYIYNYNGRYIFQGKNSVFQHREFVNATQLDRLNNGIVRHHKISYFVKARPFYKTIDENNIETAWMDFARLAPQLSKAQIQQGLATAAAFESATKSIGNMLGREGSGPRFRENIALINNFVVTEFYFDEKANGDFSLQKIGDEQRSEGNEQAFVLFEKFLRRSNMPMTKFTCSEFKSKNTATYWGQMLRSESDQNLVANTKIEIRNTNKQYLKDKINKKFKLLENILPDNYNENIQPDKYPDNYLPKEMHSLFLERNEIANKYLIRFSELKKIVHPAFAAELDRLEKWHNDLNFQLTSLLLGQKITTRSYIKIRMQIKKQYDREVYLFNQKAGIV